MSQGLTADINEPKPDSNTTMIIAIVAVVIIGAIAFAFMGKNKDDDDSTPDDGDDTGGGDISDNLGPGGTQGCYNNGQMNKDGTCTCDPNLMWTGPQCNEAPICPGTNDGGALNPTPGNENPNWNPTKGTCNCAYGFKGKDCSEFDMTSTSCQAGNMSPESSQGTLVCDCFPGWRANPVTGVCDIQVCANGGEVASDGQSCVCPIGYAGPQCRDPGTMQQMVQGLRSRLISCPRQNNCRAGCRRHRQNCRGNGWGGCDECTDCCGNGSGDSNTGCGAAQTPQCIDQNRYAYPCICEADQSVMVETGRLAERDQLWEMLTKRA